MVGLKDAVRQLKVLVLKKDGCWVGLSDDLAGGSTGDTLPELFAEFEFFRHSCAELPEDVSVGVEYVAGQSEIAPVLNAVYSAYLALPTHLRPVAVPWNLDNDRPADPVHAGPYTNLEQLRYLEALTRQLSRSLDVLQRGQRAG